MKESQHFPRCHPTVGWLGGARDKLIHSESESSCCAGPWVSERERIKQLRLDQRISKVENDFPEQLLLAAPPLLFQQRGDARLCNLTNMQIFLQQQFDLVAASHCRIASDCPKTQSRADMFKCKTQGAGMPKHYGLNTTTLHGASGWGDFLYTMADNDVIVREDQVLQALEFLDTETTSAKILCLFYSPSNGCLSLNYTHTLSFFLPLFWSFSLALSHTFAFFVSLI